MDADVVVHDLRLECVDLGHLFLDLLFDVGKLVLQGLHDLFGDALLFLKLGLALLALLAPVLVLLGHAVDVIGHEIYALAQGVRALTQYLDRLLHELDVVLSERALATVAAAATRRLRLFDSADLLRELLLLL